MRDIKTAVKENFPQTYAALQMLAADDSGQTNLVGLFIGLLVAGIVAVAVFIPVMNDTIANSNVSGNTATILNLLDLFAALLILIALASPLMRRV